MAEKKKILYIVEAMGGGVFTYIVDLANELVNKYDMYIAYAVRKQTPKNYKDYFDKRIHLIEVKNFGRAINPTKDIAAFFEVKKIAAEVKPSTSQSAINAIFAFGFDSTTDSNISAPVVIFFKSKADCKLNSVGLTNLSKLSMPLSDNSCFVYSVLISELTNLVFTQL